MKKLVLVMFATLLVAACNDNDDPAKVTKPAAPAVDNFTQAVQAEVATSPDDTEAKDIDSIAVVTPEDAEPIELN